MTLTRATGRFVTVLAGTAALWAMFGSRLAYDLGLVFVPLFRILQGPYLSERDKLRRWVVSSLAADVFLATCVTFGLYMYRPWRVATFIVGAGLAALLESTRLNRGGNRLKWMAGAIVAVSVGLFLETSITDSALVGLPAWKTVLLKARPWVLAGVVGLVRGGVAIFAFAPKDAAPSSRDELR